MPDFDLTGFESLYKSQSDTPAIRFCANVMTLNRAGADCVGRYKRVLLMYNKNTNQVAITTTTSTKGSLLFTRRKNGYYICAAKSVKRIASQNGWIGHRYIGTQHGHILVFDMSVPSDNGCEEDEYGED